MNDVPNFGWRPVRVRVERSARDEATHTTPAERASKAANDFINAVNEMGFDSEAFATTVCAQHRTLQQNAFRALGAVIRHLAQERACKRFDLRNDHATKTAERIAKQFDAELRFVPFV